MRKQWVKNWIFSKEVEAESEEGKYRMRSDGHLCITEAKLNEEFCFFLWVEVSGGTRGM